MGAVKEYPVNGPNRVLESLQTSIVPAALPFLQCPEVGAAGSPVGFGGRAILAGRTANDVASLDPGDAHVLNNCLVFRKTNGELTV